MFQKVIQFLVLDLMLPLLIICYQLTGNWGLAIIFLTLIIKGALMPFAFQGIKAQLEMQRVQPKLKEIQQKYKDKPEIMNKKMMEFYRDNRVNPLGGCMPILIQMPFFIALYSTFLSAAFNTEAGHNSSFLFIQDMTRIGIRNVDKLTHVSTYYYDNMLLIALFGLSTFISQKMMMTNPNDPTQKQMLYMMPIMITFMFTFIPVPSGCLLYLVVSNSFTIFQNIIVLRKKKALSASMGLSDPKSGSMEAGSDSISLEKNDKNVSMLKNKQDELSPVLASAGKSKRAKKKQKKNRKK
jgi:YidC/Oxa1 family membrane protein insertase